MKKTIGECVDSLKSKKLSNMAILLIFWLKYKKNVAKIVTDYKNCYLLLHGQIEKFFQ